MSKANDVIIKYFDDKILLRLKSKLKINPITECWEYQGALTKSGYGAFSIKHVWCSAHRVMFYAENGYLPEGKNLVMHDCENPRCANPKHLIDGTVKENGNYPGCIDKCRKNVKDKPWWGKSGKEHVRYGMKHSEESRKLIKEKALPRQKITDDDVRQILKSNESSNVLGKRYGVSGRLIRLIRAGTRRKLVPRHEHLLVFLTPEK